MPIFIRRNIAKLKPGCCFLDLYVYSDQWMSINFAVLEYNVSFDAVPDYNANALGSAKNHASFSGYLEKNQCSLGTQET